MTWKEEDSCALRSATFVHVFDIANQDATTSAGVLQDTLRRIKVLNSDIHDVYVRSDNAGCYHSVYGIGVVPCINKNNSCSIMYFCDPQGGKYICDRRAAHIKSYIKRYVNEGHNVLNAIDFKAAIENKMKNLQVIVSLPPTSKPPKVQLKLPNISQLFNFEFDCTSLTVWKQYEIGTGKSMNYDNAGIKVNMEIPEVYPKSVSDVTLSAPAFHSHEKGNSDKNNADSLIVKDSSLNDCQNTVEPSNVEDCSNVFTCPEDGCVATFLKYGHLCNHLDAGNHNFFVERMDLKDRARFSYADLIENRMTSTHLQDSNSVSTCVCSLEKGWALKKKRDVKRFTENQKSFMTKKFYQGETTGFKCEPEEVAREMRSVKNDHGERIFSICDFLSASQIASFFSRLCLKKRQISNSDFEEDDLRAEGRRNDFNQISDAIVDLVT